MPTLWQNQAVVLIDVRPAREGARAVPRHPQGPLCLRLCDGSPTAELSVKRRWGRAERGQVGEQSNGVPSLDPSILWKSRSAKLLYDEKHSTQPITHSLRFALVFLFCFSFGYSPIVS